VSPGVRIGIAWSVLLEPPTIEAARVAAGDDVRTRRLRNSLAFFWYFSGRFPAATKPLTALEKPICRFGDCELDPQERRLLVRGIRITLTPKVFDTLVLLVERAGHVVSKDELMTALWPRGFVDESNLTKHVWLIRKALGDGEHDARYIETVAKVGYRFVAPVRRAERGDDAPNMAAPAAMPVASADAGAGATAPLRDAPAATPEGDASPDATRPPTLREARHPPGRAVLAVAAVAGLLTVLRVVRQRAADHDEPAPGSSANALAIVELSNLSQNPKDAWLGPALEQMLATEVGLDGTMHVIADDLVRVARAGIAAPTAGGYSPRDLATLRKRLDAGFVLSGGYLVAGSADAPQLRLDLSLQSTRDEGQRASLARNGAVAELPELVADAGAQLRQRLGMADVAAETLRLTANAQPQSSEVARHLGFALDALHKFDPARARDELLDAVAQAPGYAPAHAYLAESWSALGYKARALAAAKRAAALAQDLPKEQRLQIEAQLHAAEFDWPKAIGAQRELIGLRPRNVDYRLGLVGLLLAADKPDDARTVVVETQQLAGADRDPRVALATARIAAQRGDASGADDLARRALALAQAREQTGLIAAAEVQLGIETRETAPGADGESLLRRAAADYRRIGNPHGEALARQNLANRLLDANRLQEARDEYQHAMAIYQGIGDLAGVAAIYSNLSRTLWASGDRDAAETALRRALDLRRETADLRGQAWALTGLATLKSDDAASDEVADMYRQAIALDEQVGDHGHHVFALAQLADLLRVRGDLPQAQATCAQMQAEAAALGDGGSAALNANYQCGRLALERGDVAAATATLEGALGDAKRLEDPTMQVDGELAMARIEMARRQWQSARSRLLAASEVSKRAGLAAGEADAQAALALCEQALGHPAARDQAADATRELLEAITERGETFEPKIFLAELDGLTGKAKPALATLDDVAADARKRQWLEWSFDARVAAMNVLTQTHDPLAQSFRRELETDAGQRGYGWVAVRLEGQAAGK
jgi:DNA-binding winged helix-turn-helix (wHTH) protein/tetratricopeptide (TPR) repeat protein